MTPEIEMRSGRPAAAEAACQIRSATAADAAVLAAIHGRSWSEAYRDLLTPSAIQEVNATRQEHWTRLLEPGSGHWSYLAAIAGKPAGLLRLCAADDEGTGKLGSLYLVPEYWGRGFGRQLLRFAEAELTAKGFSSLILWVLEENRRARDFYERNHWFFDGGRQEEQIGCPVTTLRYRRLGE